MNTSKFSWTHACLYILLQNEGREKKEKEKKICPIFTVDNWLLETQREHFSYDDISENE